jgi:integral membrane sensor domain MASE1
LIVFGLRVAPGILLGSLPLELALAPTILPAVGASIGDTLGPVCGYLLLRRVGFRPDLDRFRDAVALVVLGAFVATLVNALFGPTILLLSHQIPERLFGATLLIFWTGDVIGVLAAAPLLFSLRRLPQLRAMGWRAWAEIGLLAAVSFVIPFVELREIGLFFLAFPVIAWAALRYQLLAVTPCAFIMAVVVVDAATRGVGPFAGDDVMRRMAELQLLNGSLVLGGLFLAVIISQRDRARLEIERACSQLSEVIELFEDRERLPHAGELTYVQAARRPDPPAEPQPAEPQRAEPQRAEPQRAEPQPAEPQPAEPQKAAQGEGPLGSG